MIAKLPLRLLFIGFIATGTVGACSSDDASSSPGDDTEASVCVTAGNNTIEPGEECDGLNVGTNTCMTATMNAKPYGTLKCATTCKLDITGCSTMGGPPGTGGAH